MTSDEEYLERLNTKLVKSGDCLLYTGAASGKGYGRFCYRGLSRHAHRVMWTLIHGEIPQGLSVLHSCDTPLCCNCDHLFLGTQADNIADCVAKGRIAKGPNNKAPRGSKQHLAKLTEAEVCRIRILYRDGLTQQVLAERFGIYQTTVSNIVNRLTWKHTE